MRLFAATAVLLLLTACNHPLPPKQEVTFPGEPYVFKVGEIKVVEDYVSPHHFPNVEYQMTMPPAEAVQQWAKSRLAAAGHAGSLEVDIKDASVIEKDIPKKEKGLDGMLTDEQTYEFDGSLEVTLKIYTGDSALPVAHADVSAHQMMTLPENATLEDRKNLYRQMSVELMKALEVEIDKNIHQYFANYLM